MGGSAGSCPRTLCIHVYNHNIQISSSLKTTWPIKVKFYRKHLHEGETNVIINKPGHMTKMATMPIYGNNPSSTFTGNAEPIAIEIDM